MGCIDIGNYVSIPTYDHTHSNTIITKPHVHRTCAIGVLSPAGAKDFLLISVSRPALRPTQPPV
jgi:hypothetical protein